MIQNTADAEDVAQRASMTMWRRLDQHESGTNFRNWAFQVAKNAALNHLTTMRRDRHVFSKKLVNLLAELHSSNYKKVPAISTSSAFWWKRSRECPPKFAPK